MFYLSVLQLVPETGFEPRDRRFRKPQLYPTELLGRTHKIIGREGLEPSRFWQRILRPYRLPVPTPTDYNRRGGTRTHTPFGTRA